MSSTRMLQWFVCTLVSQAVAHNMHSFKMSIIKGQLFQCANTTCPPSITLTVSSVRSCRMACLNDVSCQAASFQQSTSSCQLFTYSPNQNEPMAINMEMVTMVVISGTRVPSRTYVTFRSICRSCETMRVGYRWVDQVFDGVSTLRLASEISAV